MARSNLILRAAFAALLFTAPVFAQQPIPKAVTLAEALRRSELVQPSVISANGQRKSSDLRLWIAHSAYLPNLSFSSSGNESYSEGSSRVDNNTGQVISGNTTSKSVSMSFSSGLELFDGFRRSNELKAARANDEQVEANFVDVRFQNILTTTNAFLDALAAEQVLKVREASVVRAEEQLKFAVTRLHANSASLSDSLRSVVTLGNAKLSRLQAQNTLANAEATLGRLVGSVDRVAAIDDSAFYRISATLDTSAMRTDAITISPRVKVTDAQVAVARAAYDGSRSTLYPSLNLSLGASWSGSQSNNYVLRGNRSVGLGVSWTIFNRFTREQTIDQAQIAIDNALATSADVRRQIAASVTQHFAELTTAEEQIAIAAISLQAAQEDLRVVQQRYQFAAATIVDVLTSQEALTQAEVDVVSARYAWLRAKVQMEALLGRIL